MKERQPDNEICSTNRIQEEQIFFFKNHAENNLGNLFPNHFLFVNASALQLICNIFN